MLFCSLLLTPYYATRISSPAPYYRAPDLTARPGGCASARARLERRERPSWGSRVCPDKIVCLVLSVCLVSVWCSSCFPFFLGSGLGDNLADLGPKLAGLGPKLAGLQANLGGLGPKLAGLGPKLAGLGRLTWLGG